jgi:glycosyltransferase involved in cell wall biosynthesis
MNENAYIFTSGISRKNGGSSSILDLANNMADLGFRVVIFTPFGFMDRYIYQPTDVSNKLIIRVLSSETYINSVKNPPFHKKLLNKILSLSQISDEIITEGVVVDAFGLSFDSIKALKMSNCRVIYNHAGSPNAVMKYFGLNGEKRDNLVRAKEEYLYVINQYHGILFQSQQQAQDLYKMTEWVEDRTIVLRPTVSMHGVNLVREKNTRVLNRSEYNIVIVGSVQQRKGQHLIPIISELVAKSVRNVKFHIVGHIVNIQYKKEIEALVKTLKQEDKIVFHGFKEDYLAYMNSADIILQVSEEEGVSRILREAMALSKVIVSFKLDGTNDLLVNGEDCLLSEYGDLKNISKQIVELSKDKKLMKMLSINAINNFDKKYCKSQYLLQLKEIFKNEK